MEYQVVMIFDLFDWWLMKEDSLVCNPGERSMFRKIIRGAALQLTGFRQLPVNYWLN